MNETQFIANTTADFLCQKNASDSTYYQVVTLILPINVSASLELDYNLTISGQVQSLSINIDNYFDSTIGKLNLFVLKKEISTIEEIVKRVINDLFETGISLMWILTDVLKITFLDISEIYLRTFDNYMLFQISPYLDS